MNEIKHGSRVLVINEFSRFFNKIGFISISPREGNYFIPEETSLQFLDAHFYEIHIPLNEFCIQYTIDQTKRNLLDD